MTKSKDFPRGVNFTSYTVHSYGNPLRHESERHRDIQQLLDFLFIRTPSN